MVDRYMDWYGGYIACLIYLCHGVVLYTIRDNRIVVVRQVRLIVFALDLCGRMPKTACRGICRVL